MSKNREAGAADDAIHPRVPEQITAEMSRLFRLGYSLVPLGGEDGKKPVMAFRDRRRLPLSTVVDRMAAGGSSTYGIRLEGLLVVDVDSDTPEAKVYVENYIGHSPYRVKTSRGYHLWFRHKGEKPQNVRNAFIAIDFKTGGNQMVVGPRSIRPDKVVYQAIADLPHPSELPWFGPSIALDATTTRSGAGELIPVGVRNDVLKKRAASLARTALTREELLESLIAIRDNEVEEPSSFPNMKIVELCNWAWKRKTEGNLWGDANSVVILPRAIVETLTIAKKHLALSLLAFLKARHGGNRNAVFAIDPKALRRAGHFVDGTNQLYAAIKVLEQHNALTLVRPARGKRSHHEYQLGPVQGGGKEGERAYSYISTRNGDSKKRDAA